VGNIVKFSSKLMRQVRSDTPDHEAICSLLAQIPELDAGLKQWLEVIPSTWTYSSFGASPTFIARRLSIAFPDWLSTYHSYPDPRIAAIWNHYRSARIFLHHISVIAFGRLIDVQHPDSEVFEGRRANSLAVLTSMVDEICASVPSALNQCVSITETTSPNPTPVGGYLLLWPIHVMKTRGFLDDRTRMFIDGVLNYIHHVLGINQAGNLVMLQDVGYLFKTRPRGSPTPPSTPPYGSELSNQQARRLDLRMIVED
jgi:hypothetical protein